MANGAGALRWESGTAPAYPALAPMVRSEHALFPCPVQLLLECPWIDGFLFPCSAIGRAMNTTVIEKLAEFVETLLSTGQLCVSNLCIF